MNITNLIALKLGIYKCIKNIDFCEALYNKGNSYTNPYYSCNIRFKTNAKIEIKGESFRELVNNINLMYDCKFKIIEKYETKNIKDDDLWVTINKYQNGFGVWNSVFCNMIVGEQYFIENNYKKINNYYRKNLGDEDYIVAYNLKRMEEYGTVYNI